MKRSLVFLLAASLGVTGVIIAGNCLRVSVDLVVHRDTPNEIRVGSDTKKGESLKPVTGDSEDKAAERACRNAAVEAAIQFLSGLSDCDLPTVPGTLDLPGEESGFVGGPATIAEDLQAMHDDGRICAETKPLANKKAHASYPQSVAGQDVTVHNHPSINVMPGTFPNGDECSKDEVTGEYTFDEKKIAELAVTLAHELHHAKNPPPSAGATEKEEEGDAYTFEGNLALKILCCEESSQEVKDMMCELIEEVNKKLAEFDLPLIDPGDKCGGESEGLVVSQYDFTSLKALKKHYSGSFAQGKIYGWVTLDPNSRMLHCDLNGYKALEATYDFSSQVEPALYDFQPTSFSLAETLPGPTSILVAGYSLSSLQGQVVRVSFDVNSTPPLSAISILTTNGFEFPIDAAIPHFAPNRLLVLDAANQKKLVSIKIVSGQYETIVDSQLAPDTASCSYIYVWPLLSENGDDYGVIGLHQSPDFERSQAKVTIFDKGLDGVIDGYY